MIFKYLFILLIYTLYIYFFNNLIGFFIFCFFIIHYLIFIGNLSLNRFLTYSDKLLEQVIQTKFHGELISLHYLVRIQILLFESIQKWWIILLLFVINLIFICYQDDFKFRMNFTTNAVRTNRNPTILIWAHTNIVHIKQII